MYFLKSIFDLASFTFSEESLVGEYGLYYDKERMQQHTEEEEDKEHPDIQHVAPQHRQYLGELMLTFPVQITSLIF